MKLANVAKILTDKGVNLVTGLGLEGFYLKIKNGPFTPLTIEGIGTGPHGYPAISVCHYIEVNGDLVQDPEMMMEVFQGEFFPYAMQMVTGLYDEVYILNDEGKITQLRPGVKKSLESFMRMWNVNLRHQGFVKAAKAK